MPSPTEQLLSRTTYAGDGVTSVWNFTFAGGYLDSSYVKAFTTDAFGNKTYLTIAPADLVGPYQLRVLPPVPTGHSITIYRDTPKDAPLVDFADGGAFQEVTLDTMAKQAVHIAAESSDAVNEAATDAQFYSALAVNSAAAAAVSATNASASAASTAANTAAAEAAAGTAVAAIAGITASVTAAETAATTATGAATSATASASSANSSKLAAAASEAAADSSKVAAASSATAAAGSATAAAASVSSITGSVSAAAASATSAASSATAAGTAKTAAEAAQAAAEAAAASISGGPVTSVNGQTGVVTLTAAGIGAQPAGSYATGTGTANGTNTGDETTATIKSKLGISTLSGSNTGDETATSIGTLISGAAAKTTPVDADSFGLSDSAAANVVKKFSWANLKTNVLSYIVATVNTWTKAQIGSPVALSVSANAVAVDLSLGNNFSLTLQATTGQTLSNPTNAVAGQAGAITITQNGTPSTLAYGSNWKPIDGTTPSVSTTASAVNVINYYVSSSTVIWYALNKGGVS